MQPDFPRRSYLAPLPRVPRSWALLRAAAVSFFVAVVIFGALTLQMALGSDPAIGPVEKTAARAAPTIDSPPALPAPEVAVPVQVPVPVPTPVQTSVS